MKLTVDPGFQTSRDTYLNVVLFAGDFIVVQPSKHALHNSIFRLQQLCGEYNTSISTTETKVMASCEPDPVSIKIVVDYRSVEHVRYFNYL